MKFYLNDPDSGGTPIIGINGTNSVSTIGPIPERGRSDVSFLWILPNGFPSFPRIYAVLDQEDAIPEVHSNNNKGFNVLGSSTITNIEEITDPLIHEYVLFPSYPNPFNPTTTISFSLATREKVRLEIFNSLGQRVKTLLSRDMPAGKHSVIWDARNDSGIPLGSGIYFYRISSASFIETRKMLLLK